MPDGPDVSPPDDAPTPPQGVPRPPYYYPPPQPHHPQQPQQGGYGVNPWQGGADPAGADPTPPSYLDTPAPVVSKADAEKPPTDFDG